ncbi:MAG: hypothetical protein HDT28_05355 [Clostridiales bacterium]|nr:hypothetical protein [Clostridiales bacterium]
MKITREKVKSFTRVFLFMVTAYGLSLGCWGVGLYLKVDSQTSLWDTLFYASVAVVSGLCLINIIMFVVLTRLMNRKKIKSTFDYLERIKTEVRSDYAKAKRAVTAAIVGGYLYSTVLFVLVLFTCFALGMSAEIDGTIGILLLGYLNVGFLDVIIPNRNSFEDEQTVLDSQCYPKLYELAQSAAEVLGCKSPLELALGGIEGISVLELNGKVRISLGYLYAAYLTKDELKNVLLHEFAHVVNGDVKFSYACSKHIQRFSMANSHIAICASKVFSSLGFYMLMDFRHEMYSTFASEHIEKLADDTVREKGDVQTFVNALAKSELLSRFANIAVPELDYYYYESETPSNDFCSRNVALYPAYIDKYGEIWQRYMTVELRPRVSSHPIFHERVAAMGCESYNPFVVETDEGYAAELNKFVELADKIHAQQIPYELVRQGAYLERKEAMDSYEKTLENGETPSYGQMTNALDAYSMVDEEKAIALADIMIERDVNAPFANNYKGFILKRHGDPACVEYFKIAANDYRNAESAIENIMEFALMSGDEQLITEYRENLPDKLQSMEDKFKRVSFTRDKKIEVCDLEKYVIDGFVEKVVEAGGNAVESIYICKYTDEDGEAHYPFAVKIRQFKMIGLDKQMNFFGSLGVIVDSYNGKPDFIGCNADNDLYRRVIRKGEKIFNFKKSKAK